MSDTPSLFERVEHRIARLLLGLSPGAKLRLCGGVATERDGLTLHPELQLLLSLRVRRGAKALSDGPPERARHRFRRESLVHAGERVEVGAVRDLEIHAPHALRVRHYAPARSEVPKPLLVFFHGGGFVLGDLDTHDPVCRLLCRHADVHVLAVDYRLAPEALFPAAVEDAQAAFDWARANASELGADPGRIAVGGDSAGANLAAVLCRHAVQEGRPIPALQLLIYPPIDRVEVRPSLELFAEGFLLTRADIEHFHGAYLGADVALDDPRHSLLQPDGLEGQPPAFVVTAGFDPLRDEGEAYAEALSAAGNTVVLRRFDELLHGFVNLVGVSPACRTAVVEMAGSLRAMLATLDGARRSRRATPQEEAPPRAEPTGRSA